MKKFNAEEALKGAPVKLRNGQKAYIEKYNEGSIFVYSGYVDDEIETIATWTKEGTEYCFAESQLDIVSMWQEEDEDSVSEANLEDNIEANLEDNLEANAEANAEAGQVTGENIFEKALKDKLPLRYTILEDNVNDFYCIAKTSDGDYILERKANCAVYVTKLSLFSQRLEWYIVEPKLPKAFMPKEGEEFWFIHTMKNRTVSHSNYCDNDVYYNGLASAGLAFRTKEEATQALHFLRNNIEVNHGEEQK